MAEPSAQMKDLIRGMSAPSSAEVGAKVTAPVSAGADERAAAELAAATKQRVGARIRGTAARPAPSAPDEPLPASTDPFAGLSPGAISVLKAANPSWAGPAAQPLPERAPLGAGGGPGTPETRATVQGMAATHPGFAEIDASEKAGKFSRIPAVNKLMAEQARANLQGGAADIEAQGAKEKAGFQAQASAQEQLSAARASSEAQRQADEQRLTRARDEHFAKIDQQMTQLGQSKPDPDHWWHSQSTGSKVGNVLGLLLSGLGGQRSAETVIGMIKSDIDRDMKAQESAYANQSAALNAEQRQLHDIVSQLPTPEAKATMLRTFALEQTVAKIDMEAAKRGIAATDARVIAAKRALTDEGMKNMREGQIQNAIGIQSQIAQAQAAAAYRQSPEYQMKLAKQAADIERTQAETGKAGAEAKKAEAEAKGGGKPAKEPTEGERSKAFVASKLRSYDSLTDSQKDAVKAMLPKDERSSVDDPEARKVLIAKQSAEAGGGGAKTLGSSMAED